MVISFIMSRLCSCCRAVVKIVSTSGGCIKKKPTAAGFQLPDLSPEWGRMSQTPAGEKQVVRCGRVCYIH